MNIDVKVAVQHAKEFAKTFLAEESLENFALEEIEYDDENDQWCITVGFDSGRVKKTERGPTLFGTTTEETVVRSYRVIRIDGKTGQFVSMKIREVHE